MAAKDTKYIQSPLNYTGGKYKLLPQILPLFPEDISTFVDLFCGGGNVGINVRADRILLNDSNSYVTSILKLFQKTTSSELERMIFKIIKEYALSLSTENGYDYYGCQSADGLATYNRERFNKLREDFNNRKKKDEKYYCMLYVLIIYAFNNQLRFNSSGEFNLPVGKRDFNIKMRNKLSTFVNALHNKGNVEIINTDFRKINPHNLTPEDFVYADPPYLVTCATYNEQNAWNRDSEVSLLNYLDSLTRLDIHFALSNVLSNGEKQNDILIEWLERHPEYQVHNLKFDYSNSNYQKKDKGSASEVLITNY